MINLSYRFDQDSSSLEVSGIPDVLDSDSKQIIGILSSWSLKIIGSPLLEGEKEHLDNLMQVILEYSRSYISGVRNTLISSNKIATISPLGINHKLLLNSTKKDVKPLEIILDDSELADLTRCFDLLRFDKRINIRWDIKIDKPFSRRYIRNYLNKSKINLNLLYSFFVFIFSSTILFLIPINNNFEQRDVNNIDKSNSEIKK